MKSSTLYLPGFHLPTLRRESGDRPQYEISHPGVLAEPDQGVVLRDFVATLFQPPVEL